MKLYPRNDESAPKYQAFTVRDLTVEEIRRYVDEHGRQPVRALIAGHPHELGVPGGKSDIYIFYGPKTSRILQHELLATPGIPEIPTLCSSPDGDFKMASVTSGMRDIMLKEEPRRQVPDHIFFLIRTQGPGDEGICEDKYLALRLAARNVTL